MLQVPTLGENMLTMVRSLPSCKPEFAIREQRWLDMPDLSGQTDDIGVLLSDRFP